MASGDKPVALNWTVKVNFIFPLPSTTDVKKRKGKGNKTFVLDCG